MRSLALFVICLVATAISLAGCAEESPSRDTRGTPPTANSATDPPQTQVAATTGTIRGVVRYVGKKPEPKVLDVSADPYCAACWAGKGGGPISERWPFGENDTLKNVLVYISDGLGDREFTAPS